MNNTLFLQQFLNLFGENLKTDGVLGAMTIAAKKEVETLLQNNYFAQKDYTGFFAVRTSQSFNNQTTDFLAYILAGKIMRVMPCSTRAGDFWVFNPITYGGITGTAVLAEGYYPKTWQATWQSRFGFRSVELLQVKPVKIWRDGNRNRSIDKSVSQTGMFGINIHTAGWDNIVNRWSAGCIVVPKVFWDDFTASFITIGELYNLQLVEI